MTWLAIVVLIVLCVIVSITLDRRRRARLQAEAANAAPEAAPQAEEAPAETESVSAQAVALASRFTDRVTSVVQGGPQALYNRIARRQPSDLPQRFQAWFANQAGAEAHVQAWIDSLPEDGLEAFTDHLAGFCSQMGFELAWLLEQDLNLYPDVANSATQIVLHYTNACQQAASAQADLKAYTMLKMFEQNPRDRKHQALVQALCAKLTDAGLVAVSMPEYMMATAKEQQQIAIDAINEAASKDHAAFLRIFQETLYATAEAPAVEEESVVASENGVTETTAAETPA